VEGTDSLHFAVYAKQLGAGLDEQLEKFICDHPDTRLIIIDMPGRTEKDFTEAVRLAETAGFIGGNTYSIKGMTIYEAEKNKTVLTIMLSESSLMISLE